MTGSKRSISTIFIPIAFCLSCITVVAQTSASGSSRLQVRSEYIFPSQDLHVHSSSIVELPGGDLIACWFEGSGERTANDVVVKGSRLKKGASEWSKTFILADTPGHPDCNPTLFIDKENGRHSLAVSLSDDEGETWRWTRHLEKTGPGEGSFSYPSVIQAKDGVIHITYSFHLSDKKTIKHVAFSAKWIKENE